MRIEKTETFIEHDIFVNGTKVGTVELCPEHNEIARLVIFEPYQNQGYGTDVVKKLLAQGYKSLWVRSDNPRAIHVYEKCGFKKGYTYMFEMVADKAESEVDEMGEQMTFPDSFEEFAKLYGFKDDKEVYTNGSDLIPIFRVKQWLEHIETDTAYEGDKCASKWIPVSEKLPESAGVYIVTCEITNRFNERINVTDAYCFYYGTWYDDNRVNDARKIVDNEVKAWMPLPEPFVESEEV